MAYKYSKGATVQGDIKAADDTQRDTLIDFGEDRIDLQTSGTVRFTVENDTITTTLPIHVSGSAIEGIRVAKGGSDYRAIVFEVDGQDNANISVSNAENFVIQNEMNGKDIQFWVNPSAGSSVQAMTIKEDGKVGIGITTPSRALDVQGDVMIRGNNILDNSGGNCVSFDGSGNTAIDGTLVTDGARFVKVDEASSFPFTVGAGHHFINVSGSGARAINLPTVSPNDVGRVLTIFDGQGNADTGTITINVGDSVNEMLGGGTSYAISSPGGAVTILCTDENGWAIINKVT